MRSLFRLGQPLAEWHTTNERGIMYRGRAAEKLAKQAVWRTWTEFGECPHEDLHKPGRIHLDPLGYLHI
ncbi:MAG: hypothetical protein MJA84_05710 [Firmicutes bacterium]|nr:hypothetical protein [Bacillota bacterium]